MLCSVASLVLIAGICATTIAGADAQANECRSDVFSDAFIAELVETAPDLAITAAVYDTRSHCWYELHPELALTTASAIKLQVLAANLVRLEGLGRGFTETEARYAERMMWFSHNSPATSSLYVAVGRNGMRAYSEAVGAPGMQHSAIYGVTRASARALTLVALSALHDGSPGPLTSESRAVARALTAGVHPTQSWGISAGLPPGWKSHLKNGFFPCINCGPFSGVYTWRVASTGFNADVIGDQGYAISIMTDGARSQREGIDVVEVVSRHVAAALAPAGEAARPIDNANCVTVDAGESSASITQRLGLTTNDWPEVRWVSGNEGPLRGQLMCGDAPLAETEACLCPGEFIERRNRLRRG